MPRTVEEVVDENVNKLFSTTILQGLDSKDKKNSKPSYNVSLTHGSSMPAIIFRKSQVQAGRVMMAPMYDQKSTVEISASPCLYKTAIVCR